MGNTQSVIDLIWEGPYSWPKYEKQNELASIPDIPGVYLQTFQYNNGYLIYAAGITRRRVSTRFKEHTRNYLNGEYTVLSVDAVQMGIRKEIWHGWGYARDHRNEFEENKFEILEAVNKQLLAFHIFIGTPGDTPRILERIEASIMNNLYLQSPPICDIPDKGMFLSPKLETEDSIYIRNHSESVIFGLPELLEI